MNKMMRSVKPPMDMHAIARRQDLCGTRGILRECALVLLAVCF